MVRQPSTLQGDDDFSIFYLAIPETKKELIIPHFLGE